MNLMVWVFLLADDEEHLWKCPIQKGREERERKKREEEIELWLWFERCEYPFSSYHWLTSDIRIPDPTVNWLQKHFNPIPWRVNVVHKSNLMWSICLRKQLSESTVAMHLPLFLLEFSNKYSDQIDHHNYPRYYSTKRQYFWLHILRRWRYERLNSLLKTWRTCIHRNTPSHSNRFIR